MQELTWVHWLWFGYFISAFLCFAENMREMYYRLKAEKQEKANKYNRGNPMTYGAMVWYFTFPFVPVFNTLGAGLYIYERYEKFIRVFDKPVIKPYKGE